MKFQFTSGLFVICVALHAPAAADNLPPVYVFSELGDSDITSCHFDTRSATATAEAAFRFNKTPLAQREEYMGDDAIEFFININAF